MFQASTSRFLLALVLAAASVFSAKLAAQDSSSTDDPNDVPLGDVARNLRNGKPAPKQVIDNDNLSEVVNQAENRHGSILRFLMSADDKNFRAAVPDVTCSLAFTASTKALWSQQYAQMNLPPSEVFKLTGPATIEGDALTVSLFNGTDWHVSEIDVAFTLVKKNIPNSVSLAGEVTPETSSPAFQLSQNNLESDAVRPEKKPDQTVIYKMRAADPPLTTATFSAPLDLDLVSGQEWHWAILQAKGYPPQNLATTTGNPPSPDAQGVDSTQPETSGHEVPLTASPVALTQPQ